MSNAEIVIVSYHTTGTPYECEADHLRRSCQRVGLEPYQVSIPNMGSWQRNCCQKPLVIRNALLALRRPVLYVDADATIERPIDGLADIVGDAVWAAHIMDKARWGQDTRRRSHSLMSGTLYFSWSADALTVLDAWLTAIRRRPDRWDQRSLEAVWNHPVDYITHFGHTGANPWFAELPAEWCAIDRTMWGLDAVVRHHQASRRLKQIIDRGPH